VWLLKVSLHCFFRQPQLTGKKDSLRGGKKPLAKLASKLKELLANSKFHSHLASWRVVNPTPAKVQAACAFHRKT
jgi:hypothetical protein